MVEIFKTNVVSHRQAEKLLAILQQYFPHYEMNFVLDDIDKVLRVEGGDLQIEHIQEALRKNGFICEVLI
ncbi:MAG: hypothetical protein K6T34_04655 [Thermoflavifilum sp.]|nr:hypothetical protein [Thermoflavifilum sp.]